MNKNELLLDFMAKACHYAQEHCGDPQAWPKNVGDRANLLQCTSFQVACFLAQSTEKGDSGVESNVVLKELSSNRKNKHGLMIKSVEQWKRIILKLVKELGGWK